MPHYEPYKYPDNPYRVAPPDQAPGEIELREPTAKEIAEMEFDVEREVLDSLKNGTDFEFYDDLGGRHTWDYATVWDVLQNYLNTHQMAEIMAAVMECGMSADGVRYALAVRDTLYRKAIAPFVEEQAQRRLDAAIEQEAQDARESWREE